MAKKLCPVCGAESVPPYGPKDAPILILGEYPGQVEIEWGVPLVGPTGQVLKEELRRLGLDMKKCRIANLWVHIPDKKSPKYKECWQFGQKVALKEVQNRKGILLLGSECAEYFVGKKVMEIAGLRVEDECQIVKTDVMVCSPNPAIVFKMNGVVGDLRFALKTFVESVDQWI